jgi:hypothetical protein
VQPTGDLVRFAPVTVATFLVFGLVAIALAVAVLI